MDSNPGIQELPVELGQLPNLWQLDIEDLNISNVPQSVRNEGKDGCETHKVLLSEVIWHLYWVVVGQKKSQDHKFGTEPGAWNQPTLNHTLEPGLGLAPLVVPPKSVQWPQLEKSVKESF